MIKKIFLKFRNAIKGPILSMLYNFLMSPAKNFKGRKLFDSTELALLHRALINQNLFGIDGKMVSTFENNFSQSYNVPYAVASTSGTAAIHTALNAVNINPGDEVITTPITDLGTIIPIINEGGIPVFADIDDSYNMNPKDVEQKITPRTKAIIAVHLFGNPCDMDALVAVAKKHNVVLIEDCCQAHMTEYKGKYVGTIGDIGCFSFQQSKHMTTGDGGMTITSNNSYYEHMKLFVDKGYARKGFGARAYLFHGQNYRMNELTASVGIAQLSKVKNVIERRNELGRYMTELLSDIDCLQTCPVIDGSTHSYWLYPLYYKGNHLNQFADALKKEKVSGFAGYTVKPIYMCSESLTAKKTYGNSQYPFTWKDVQKQYEYKEGLCPKAEETLRHLYCINLNECWTREKVENVAESIRKVCLLLEGEQTNKSHDTSIQKPLNESPKVSGEKKRIAIIGCGQMGKWHLDSYKVNPDVEIAAYVDSNIEKARNFTRFVEAPVYESHTEMIKNEKIDAASLCTVPSTHRAIVMDLLDAGIHVLCEKPLAISVNDSREMIEMANKKKLVLLTAFKFRFFEEVKNAKEIISSGGLGKILNFRIMFGGAIDMVGSWYVNKEISGGGIIMDNGPHAFDLIRNVLGEINQVFAQPSNYQDIKDVEDTAQINCILKDGSKGVIDISWSSSIPSKTYFEIFGENGTVLLDFSGISYKYKTWNDWKRIDNAKTMKQVFADQIEHFVNSVNGDGPVDTINEDGLKAQEIIEMAYQSLNTQSQEYKQITA